MSFIIEKLDWDALRLFIEVADAGSLSLAASRTGTSAPTLHRRMADLENVLGTELFVRGATGYSLTQSGLELRRLADDAASAVAQIGEWCSGQLSPPLRIACGPWTSLFLGRVSDRISASLDGGRFRLIVGTTQTDLTRRQADIGLRNSAPTQLGLAGQRVCHVAFAAYGTPDLAGNARAMGLMQAFETMRWIILDRDRPTASSRYLASVLAEQPVASCDHPMPMLELAQTGLGLCLLPCFVGDATPGLKRVGDPIPALRQEQWLVTADTRRHDPPIRAGIKVLKRVWHDHRHTFSGHI
ncbi:MAG: LysR family transcriptional regulator [Pseudomonadota bacterium]